MNNFLPPYERPNFLERNLRVSYKETLRSSKPEGGDQQDSQMELGVVVRGPVSTSHISTTTLWVISSQVLLTMDAEGFNIKQEDCAIWSQSVMSVMCMYNCNV